MPFLLRHLVLLHVFLLAAGLAWVHGGTRVDHLGWVPWLTLAVLEWLFLLPPVRRGETLADARSRVWCGVARDPWLYVSLALSLFLLIQWANGGRGMLFDAARGTDVPRPPPIPWLPGCVERGEAVQLLYWFPPVCAAVLAVRHGVTRNGRRLLLHLLVWSGGLLALFGFVENLIGTKAMYWMTPLPAHFFASFGYPNHAGAYFALLFAAGAGLWCHATTEGDDRERRRRWRVLLPTVLCLAAVWASRSRAAIFLSTGLLFAGGVYLLGHFWRRLGLGDRVQAVSLGLAVLVAGAAFYYVIYPNNPVRGKMAAIDFASPRAVRDAVAQRWYLIPKAVAIWRDHPWFGVGGWGYRSFLGQYIDKAEQEKYIWTGGANVHNDGAQFLAEHGIVGGALLMTMVGLLLMPALRGLDCSVVRCDADASHLACLSQRHRVHRAGLFSLWPLCLCERRIGLRARPALGQGTAGGDSIFPPPALFRLPPGPLFLLAGAGCTVLHSLVDLPFRCPAVLIAWMLALACLPALATRQ